MCLFYSLRTSHLSKTPPTQLHTLVTINHFVYENGSHVYLVFFLGIFSVRVDEVIMDVTMDVLNSIHKGKCDDGRVNLNTIRLNVHRNSRSSKIHFVSGICSVYRGVSLAGRPAAFVLPPGGDNSRWKRWCVLSRDGRAVSLSDCTSRVETR